MTRSELKAAGVTPAEIRRLAANGALLRVYPGVYRVGHLAPSVDAWYLAAVKACGSGALLFGPAAAHQFGLTKGLAPPPHVLTTTERKIKGIETRRMRRTAPAHTAWRAIPTTTVAETLVDLAATLSPHDLARAAHEAMVLHRTQPVHVTTALQARPNAKGATDLKAVLTGDTKVLLSALERRFIQLLEQANLPLPLTNHKTDGHYIDCRWPAHHLTVELDSYRYHASRHAWENDRKRERRARARGDRFRRYTHDDVHLRPDETVADVTSLLPPRASP